MTSNNRRSASRPAPGATDAMYPSFIRQAADAPRLTREEEKELIRRWQRSRDRKAAEKLARCSMRYVVAIACKYRRYNVPIDVLISEGNLGLVRAMDKFDLEQENRFSTYATYWIRYYVLDHIMRSWSIVGGGSGALKTRLFFRLRLEKGKWRTAPLPRVSNWSQAS
jgi:RNA polymerase sigma-32 factor